LLLTFPPITSSEGIPSLLLMPRIPPELAARLGGDDSSALGRFIDAAETTLRLVYEANVADYRETRGDDAQLFGLKVWKHEWYALAQELAEDESISLVENNGSYEVHIGPLRIGVYGLGHLASDDILQSFPDSSPFKRGFGEQNQLRLFALETVERPPDASSFALNSLTLGHFGNARDGFVKGYLGAWIFNESNHKRWAWIERLDQPDEGVEPLPVRPPIVPFSDRPREALEVRPRAPA
jgi:hypothetical protein